MIRPANPSSKLKDREVNMTRHMKKDPGVIILNILSFIFGQNFKPSKNWVVYIEIWRDIRILLRYDVQIRHNMLNLDRNQIKFLSQNSAFRFRVDFAYCVCLHILKKKRKMLRMSKADITKLLAQTKYGIVVRFSL